MSVNIQSSTSRLLRMKDVVKLTSLGQSTINLWVTQGKFPKPLKPSPTIKLWREQDISSWLSSISSDSGEK